jgi:hypothetical protein
MGAVLVLAVVLALCLLAPRYGADSRGLDERDRRSWWPGARRDG